MCVRAHASLSETFFWFSIFLIEKQSKCRSQHANFYDSQDDLQKKSKQTQKQSFALQEEITVDSHESEASKQQPVID